jgi:hypothetical protein
MSWLDGFLDYYATKRRTFIWIWGLASAVIVFCLMVHVLPFTYASATSKGVVTARNYWSKGYSYTYRYEVDGQAYTGESDLGAWDGNGPYQKLVPGVEVPITYRLDNPSRSMGGTMGTWSKATLRFLLRLAVLCFVILPIPLYIKELRSGR